MLLSRRSVLKVGVAGLLLPQVMPQVLPQATFGGGRVRQYSGFDQWRTDFESGMRARMRAANVVGASVAITSKDTAVRYAAAFGFADLSTQRELTADTPMHLASMSKLFTATALVQLFEREGLDLDADINNFLAFSVKNPRYRNLRITPRHLLTHTSSISDEGYLDDFVAPGDPKLGLAEFLKRYLTPGGRYYSPRTSFSTARPGAKWDYSNVGMSLAGHIVETVSGQDFPTYIQENLLQPLGIENAHWYIRDFAPDVLAKPYVCEKGRFVELPQEGYPDLPAGLLRCSVSDFARSMHAMLGQETGSKALLSSSAVNEMLRRQVTRAIHPYQGLGWTEEETTQRKVVGHTGSDDGASNMVALTPDCSQAVTVLMNIDGTDKTSKFRASVIDDLFVGASLAQ